MEYTVSISFAINARVDKNYDIKKLDFIFMIFLIYCVKGGHLTSSNFKLLYNITFCALFLPVQQLEFS